MSGIYTVFQKKKNIVIRFAMLVCFLHPCLCLGKHKCPPWHVFFPKLFLVISSNQSSIPFFWYINMLTIGKLYCLRVMPHRCCTVLTWGKLKTIFFCVPPWCKHLINWEVYKNCHCVFVYDLKKNQIATLAKEDDLCWYNSYFALLWLQMGQKHVCPPVTQTVN